MTNLTAQAIRGALAASQSSRYTLGTVPLYRYNIGGAFVISGRGGSFSQGGFTYGKV